MDVASAYREIRRVAEAAGDLGRRTIASGAELFGHVPHVAPEAWLHVLFPPLDDAGLAELEAKIGALPHDYEQWLARSNGLNLFSDSLSLDGLRRDYSRSADVYEPYDADVANVHERPRNAPNDAVFVGGYSWDGSLLFIHRGEPTVVRCGRRDASPLNTWPDLGTMLVEEAARIGALHESHGRLLDENRPTCPEPVAA